MKKLIGIFFIAVTVCVLSCKKDYNAEPQTKQVSSDADALKPKEGYNTNTALISRGKPQRDRVTDLIATGISSNQIQLSFTATAPQYYVYREGFYIATVSSGAYTDGGLLPGSTHSYQVKSTDKFGQLSNVATATTLTGGGGGDGGQGTPNILFLDFDGGFNTNTNWNVGQLSESGLTIDQINWIVDSTQRSYNAVDQRIIVTADGTIGASADPFYSQHTYITQTNFYGQVGGVSYVGSFSWGDRTPNFVFSQLLYYNESYIQRAITHEDGHAFTLQHDSCGGNYGYSGNWMGASYGRPGFFTAKLDRTCTFVDQPAVIKSKLK